MIHSWDTLKAALEPEYRVLREIARAVSVVLLAEDRRQGRLVAIKIPRPECASARTAERFHDEIRIAGRMQHPSILPLYRSGEVLGLPYFVMPYVEGETLRDKLEGGRALPVADALSITETVGRALQYAHRQHVVHRDIKPENILFWNDYPVLTDFGIALATDGASAEWEAGPRQPVGTPEYMSPEQAAGEDDVKPASDVYSLACVLYEMLSGQPPFTGSALEIVTQHLTAPAPRLWNVVPGVTRLLSDTVERAMAKASGDRFANAGEFVTALLEARSSAESARAAIAGFPFVEVSRALAFAP